MATKVQIVIADAKVIAREEGITKAMAFVKTRGVTTIKTDRLKEILLDGEIKEAGVHAD